MAEQAEATEAGGRGRRWRSGSAGLGLCVAAGTLSQLGDTMQMFAVNWEATRYGARVAGLVATVGVLPRAVLMLVGGVLADRYGIRRIMIICDAVMAVLVAIGCAVLVSSDAGLAVIVGLAVGGGIVSAFYLPAAGGFVRLFVPDDRLAIVGARVAGVQQLARMVGPALGAVSIVAFGLTGTLGLNLATFLIILMALIMVRPPRRLAAVESTGHPGRQVLDGPRPDPPISAYCAAPYGHTDGVADAQRSTRPPSRRRRRHCTRLVPLVTAQIGGSSLRRAARTPGMPAALGSVALVAGGVLPVIYLGVPLLARELAWGAPAAGWIESAWIVGSLLVTGVIAKFGPARRMGLLIMLGPLVAAVGAAMIATAPLVPVAVGGSVLLGVGTAAFTGHLGPLYLAWTPPELTGRFQSLFGIVQAVPLVLVNTPYGLLADSFGARIALLASAAISLVAALLVGATRRLRTATH